MTVAPGGVQLTGAVVFDLTGDNSIYTIQGGNLTVASGGTAFSVGPVSGGFGPSAVINSNIIGSDGVNVVGVGTLVLNGTNTYAGGTTICNCAMLQLGDATHVASIVGAVTNEGFFNIVNANTSGITTILNDGFFGPATTTFFNANSAGSITITNTNGGETDFGTFGGSDTATAGNATIVNDGGGTMFFAQTTAGTATITNQAGGGIVFLDQSSAGNATITNNNNGLTEFNAFSTAGNATVITSSGGRTEFFDNSTGGNARFITNGTGVVDFGASIGPDSDGRITAGSIEGSGSYFIGGGNTLVVGGNHRSTDVSGVIADFDPCGCGPMGPGSLEKVGTGTLTLSGTNTYTGLTLVNEGTLLVTGSIASSAIVMVDNGATLGGTGTVAPTFLNGGAVLAPGLPTSLGTLTVNDQLVFCNCTFYDVKVTSGGSDVTMVVSAGGPAVAALEGTVRVKSLDGTYRFNSPYTILTAQGGFDFGVGPTRFNSLVTPTGINATLSYTSTDVNLTLSSALGQLSGLNVNQRNVANALDGAFNAGGISGALGAIFNGNVPQNLTQVSGELGTGSQQGTFDAMNLFLSLLSDPSGRNGGFGGNAGAIPFAEESALGYAARKPRAARDAFAKFPTKADVARNDLFDPRWSVWGIRLSAAAATLAATPRSDRTTRPHARSVLRLAPTIASRAIRWLASRSRAAAPISASPVSAPGARICSRPAPSFATTSATPMSPPPRPMAGRT